MPPRNYVLTCPPIVCITGCRRLKRHHGNSRMKAPVVLLALATVCFALAAQDQVRQYTAIGSASVKEQACQDARSRVAAAIASDSKQRNTHHLTYAYSSSVSECTCTEKLGEEKVEHCISSVTPNCVDNRRVVRASSVWSCNATGVLTITVTPAK